MYVRVVSARALYNSMQIRMGAPEPEIAFVLLIHLEIADDHVTEEDVGPSMAPKYLAQPEI